MIIPADTTPIWGWMLPFCDAHTEKWGAPGKKAVLDSRGMDFGGDGELVGSANVDGDVGVVERMLLSDTAGQQEDPVDRYWR